MKNTGHYFDFRNDINTTLFYLKTALDKLSQVHKSPSHEEHSAECIWFMKIGLY